MQKVRQATSKKASKLVGEKEMDGLKKHDVRRFVKPELRKAIQAPCEGGYSSADDVWIVWRQYVSEGASRLPQIYCICTTEEMTEIHIGMAIEGVLDLYEKKLVVIHVERVPTNHAFGSSFNKAMESLGTLPRHRERLSGD